MNSQISPLRFGSLFNYSMKHISPEASREHVKDELKPVLEHYNNSEIGQNDQFYGKLDGDTLKVVCLDSMDSSVKGTLRSFLLKTVRNSTLHDENTDIFAESNPRKEIISVFPEPDENVRVPDEQALAQIKKTF